MTDIKMIRTKVCLIGDNNTFVGYEYYLVNVKSHEQRLLHSTLKSINPKDLAYHDQEAIRICRARIDNLNAEPLNNGSCNDDRSIAHELENFKNTRPKKIGI